MVPEAPKPAPPIERLRNLLKLNADAISRDSQNVDELEEKRTITLNEREVINIEYNRGNGSEKREMLECRFERDGALALVVVFGERGLEYLGFDEEELRLSFAGSKEIHMKRHLDIGPSGGESKIEVLDEEGIDFQEWSGPIIDWMENVIKNGKIGEIPFKITAFSEDGRISKLKEGLRLLLKNAYYGAFSERSIADRNTYLRNATEIRDVGVSLGLITLEEDKEVLDECLREYKESTSRS